MSPKRITNLALIVAGISVLGIIAMLLSRPGWGLLNWWPAASLGFSLLLIMIALVRGASMAAQRRIDMVDVMNDCNAGIPHPDNS
jgi:hypothetical protein